MSKESLIIALIQQDLKHHQLVLGLNQLGLAAVDKHMLELFTVVQQLMEVPESLENEWGKTYTNYMNFATNFKIEGNSQSLEPLAGGCYQHLQAILEL